MSAASPCINVCRIDPVASLCVGCHRSLDEIARWRDMTDAQRQRVLQALPMRRRALEQARQAQQ